MALIIVSVKQGYGTYIAKFGKQNASCTAGESQAVKTLAEKIFGKLQRVEIAYREQRDHDESEWSISPDPTQICSVCGCNFDHACESGCHWVSDDLCSACSGAPVLSGIDRTTSGAIGQP
jgi:hypothetical protein